MLSRFWFAVGVLSLAIAWLLPNHYPPWMAFHAEFWVFIVLSVLGLWLLRQGTTAFSISRISYLILVIAFVPMIQWSLGQILDLGTAWMCTAYLLGLGAAIELGVHWEKNAPNEAADYLFISVIVAAFVSTLLQIYQLIGWNFAGIWIMHAQNNSRFFANLAQPNQLASLELIGVVGCAWLHYRKHIRATFAILLAAGLLIGIVLTESRTAIINFYILAVLLATIKNNENRDRKWVVFLGLATYFAICIAVVPVVENLLQGTVSHKLRDAAINSDLRPDIWKMFLHASYLRPWLGYGWGQVTMANLTVATTIEGHLGLLNASHNLILDMILWMGYPMAAAVLLSIAWMMWGIVGKCGDALSRCMLGFLIVLVVHAMLELPLHYAYFLLPFGLMLGTLSARTNDGSLPVTKRWPKILLHCTAATLGLLIARDYLIIENNMYRLRFQAQSIQIEPELERRPVWLLNQFNDYFVYALAKPQKNMTDAELNRIRNSVFTMPSGRTLYNLAADLALAGHIDEARNWQLILCTTMDTAICQEAQERWTASGLYAQTGMHWAEK